MASERGHRAPATRHVKARIPSCLRAHRVDRSLGNESKQERLPRHSTRAPDFASHCPGSFCFRSPRSNPHPPQPPSSIPHEAPALLVDIQLQLGVLSVLVVGGQRAAEPQPEQRHAQHGRVAAAELEEDDGVRGGVVAREGPFLVADGVAGGQGEKHETM